MLGILYLDSTHPMHALSGLNEKIQRACSDAGNVLGASSLSKALRSGKTLERELARGGHAEALPSVIPLVPGWHLALFQTTRYVGGILRLCEVARRNWLVCWATSQARESPQHYSVP
jgi:hypothetical protein